MVELHVKDAARIAIAPVNTATVAFVAVKLQLWRATPAATATSATARSAAFDTTFECYNADTAAPVSSVGLSNIMKSQVATEFKSQFERRGDSWDTLLAGLSRDS